MIELLKLLPLMLRKSGDSEEVREKAVFAAWIGAVGPQLRQVSSPLKFERKTLIVAVSTSDWQLQLRRIRGQVLFKLNSLLGSPTVTTLEFVVNPSMIRRSPQHLTQSVDFVAPETHARSLADNAHAIADPEIRDAFLRAAGKCLDRRNR